MPNDLGRDSKSGLVVFFDDLEAPGALATLRVGACARDQTSQHTRTHGKERERERNAPVHHGKRCGRKGEGGEPGHRSLRFRASLGRECHRRALLRLPSALPRGSDPREPPVLSRKLHAPASEGRGFRRHLHAVGRRGRGALWVLCVHSLEGASEQGASPWVGGIKRCPRGDEREVVGHGD